MKRVPSRFAIVQLAAKRVRQIRDGEGEFIFKNSKNEEGIRALREIAADKLFASEPIRGLQYYDHF